MESSSKSIKSGVFFTAIGKYTNVFLTVLIGAILSRLLTPEEFGIVAIVTVFIAFFNLLSDMGVGPAIIQNQNLSSKDIESIFCFTLLVGIFFGGIFFLSANFVASFYENQKLVDVVQLLSVAICFYSFQVVPMALCQKQFKFKKLAFFNVLVQLVSGSIAILLAYNDFSYFSLVIKIILDGILNFLILYLLNPVSLIFRINSNSIKKIAKFSMFQFLFNFVNYFSRNTDNLFIGKYLGLTSLGFYDKSYRLMMMPIMNITHVISPVLLPVLSKYNNDKDRVYNAYLKVLKPLSFIGFSLSIFLFFSSKEIILIIFGDQWLKSIPVFKILSLTVGLQIVLSSSGSIFQALNKTNLLLLSGILSTLVMLSAISYGVFIGKNLESVGYSLVIAFSLNFIVSFFILIKKCLGRSYYNFLKIFLKPIITGFVILISLSIINVFLIENIYISLLVKCLVAVIVFIITVSFFDDNFYRMKEKLKLLLNKNKI